MENSIDNDTDARRRLWRSGARWGLLEQPEEHSQSTAAFLVMPNSNGMSAYGRPTCLIPG